MALRRILIVGGSTRAAADSGRRAGWEPVCADCFADLDLRAIAQVIPVTKYPDSIPDDVAQVHADAWFYCGALENHPEIVERMTNSKANYGRLLGTPAGTLRIVRDPSWLMEILRSAGLPVLDVFPQSSPPSPDGSWLQKPLSSAGGRAIRVWNQAARASQINEPHYFQRRVGGIGLSAMFSVENGTAAWLGASREVSANEFGSRRANLPTNPIVGRQSKAPEGMVEKSNPAPTTELSEQLMNVPTEFSYVGSCGPLERIPFAEENRFRPESDVSIAKPTGWASKILSESAKTKNLVAYEAIRSQLTVIAQVLARNAPGLKGIVGLDFRFDGSTAWLTEINPRYTASVEILELATGRSLLNQMIKDQQPSNGLDSITPTAPEAASRPETIDSATFENMKLIHKAPGQEQLPVSPGPLAPALRGAGRGKANSFESKTRNSFEDRFKAPECVPPYVVAKRILYAASPLRAPDLSPYLQTRNPWQVPILADIPMPGTRIEPGWPICTVLASGPDDLSVQATMTEQLDKIKTDLGIKQ